MVRHELYAAKCVTQTPNTSKTDISHVDCIELKAGLSFAFGFEDQHLIIRVYKFFI